MNSPAKNLNSDGLSRDFVRQRTLQAMEKGEGLGLDFHGSEYRLYRDVYLKDLEDTIFPPDLSKDEWDRRMDFVERNRLNFL